MFSSSVSISLSLFLWKRSIS